MKVLSLGGQPIGLGGAPIRFPTLAQNTSALHCWSAEDSTVTVDAGKATAATDIGSGTAVSLELDTGPFSALLGEDVPGPTYVPNDPRFGGRASFDCTEVIGTIDFGGPLDVGPMLICEFAPSGLDQPYWMAGLVRAGTDSLGAWDGNDPVVPPGATVTAGESNGNWALITGLGGTWLESPVPIDPDQTVLLVAIVNGTQSAIGVAYDDGGIASSFTPGSLPAGHDARDVYIGFSKLAAVADLAIISGSPSETQLLSVLSWATPFL